MSSKQRKTLDSIFKDPVSRNIKFKDIESLLKSLGCEIIEGNGSRVTFLYGKRKLNCHRPHPNPDTPIYRVKLVREFLMNIGVSNET